MTGEEIFKRLILNTTGDVVTEIRNSEIEVEVDTYGCSCCGDTETSANINITYRTEDKTYDYVSYGQYDMDSFVEDVAKAATDLQEIKLGLVKLDG